MDINELAVMVGDHGARIKNIESTVTQTSVDVRSLMDQFHTVKGGKAAHAPYRVWMGRTLSNMASAILGALAAIKFGHHS